MQGVPPTSLPNTLDKSCIPFCHHMLQAGIDFVTVIINLIIHPPLISHYTQKCSLNQPFSTHILMVPKMSWFHLEFFYMTGAKGYLYNQSAQFWLGSKQVTWVF